MNIQTILLWYKCRHRDIWVTDKDVNNALFTLSPYVNQTGRRLATLWHFTWSAPHTNPLTYLRTCLKSLTCHRRSAATFCFLAAAGTYSRSFCEFFGVNNSVNNFSSMNHPHQADVAGLVFIQMLFWASETCVVVGFAQLLCTASLQALQAEILEVADPWEKHQISLQKITSL